MASDPRDRSFEKALARNLRADAPVAPRACADAETLAAYHERLLAPEQMIFWKGHITSCLRCQQILAQLEATDEILLETSGQAEQEEDTLAETAFAGAMPERRADQQALSAGRAAVAAARSPVSIAKPRKAAYWRWVAPAGALAAGLLVWVAVRESPQPLKLAKTQQQVVSTARSEAPQVPAPAARDNSSVSDVVRDLKTSPETSGLAGALQQRVEAPSEKKALASPRAKSDLPRSDAEADHSRNALVAPLNRIANDPTLGGKREAETKDLDKQARTFDAAGPAPAAAPVAPPSVAQSVEVAPAPAAAQPTARAKARQEALQSVAPSQQQQMQAMDGISRFKDSAAVRLANSKTPAMIPAPGGSVLWRAGPAGVIEHSLDSGATWTLQPSGVIADLLAGSAPSSKVCWVVGQAGTVLRTTDGGAHWVKLTPPSDEDLAAVFPADARQATVFSARAAYQTTDGGRTWKKLAPE